MLCVRGTVRTSRRKRRSITSYIFVYMYTFTVAWVPAPLGAASWMRSSLSLHPTHSCGIIFMHYHCMSQSLNYMCVLRYLRVRAAFQVQGFPHGPYRFLFISFVFSDANVLPMEIALSGLRKVGVKAEPLRDLACRVPRATADIPM